MVLFCKDTEVPWLFQDLRLQRHVSHILVSWKFYIVSGNLPPLAGQWIPFWRRTVVGHRDNTVLCCNCCCCCCWCCIGHSLVLGCSHLFLVYKMNLQSQKISHFLLCYFDMTKIHYVRCHIKQNDWSFIKWNKISTNLVFTVGRKWKWHFLKTEEYT